MSASERPLAVSLAHEVLRDPSTHGWLAPLAREYLKEVEARPEQPFKATEVVPVTGLRESGPA